MIRPETTTFGTELKRKLEGIMTVEGSALQSSMNKVGLGVIAGVGAAAAISVKLQESLEKNQARIAAQADISVEAAQKITKSFQSTAFQSIFSANQMAEAYAKIAGQLGDLAGHALNATEALGFMKTASDLAEASGQGLDSTTANLAKIMQGYQIKVAEAAKTSDTLFNASRLTGNGVDQLANVITRLHARLGFAAGSVQDMGAMLLDLTEHGVTGGRGLMVLSGAMNALIEPSDKVKQAQQDLGLHFYNTRGQFIGFRGALEQLSPKLKGLTQEQQVALLKSIGLGSQAKGLLDTINAGPAAFDRANAAVNRQGVAHSAAEKQAKTFHHQILELKAGLTDLGEKVGAALIPKIEGLAHALSDGITWLEKHKKVAEALGIVLGTFLALSVLVTLKNAIGGMISKIAEAITSIFAWGTTTEAEATGVEASMLGALTAIQTAVEGIAAQLGVAAEETTASLEEMAVSAEVSGGIMDVALGPVGLALLAISAIALLVATHWKTISRVAEEVGKAIMHFLGGALDWIKQHWPLIVGFIIAPWFVIGNLIVHELLKFKGKILDFFVNAVTWLFHAGEDVLKGIVEGIVHGEIALMHFWIDLPGKILGWIGDAAKWLWHTGGDILKGLIKGMIDFVPHAIKDVLGVVDKIQHAMTHPWEAFSPSRVTMRLGQNIMEGLAIGITNNGHLPQLALNKVTMEPPKAGALGAIGIGQEGAAIVKAINEMVNMTRQNTDAVRRQTSQLQQPLAVKLDAGKSAVQSVDSAANFVSGLFR